MLVTSSTILDIPVQFHVSTNGQWLATADGDTIAYGDSFKQVKRLARIELKKKQIRVAVPFTFIDRTTNKLLSAIARGRHAAQRYRILVWVDDGTENGRNDYIDAYSYRRADVLKPDLTTKAIERIKYLHDERAKTKERLDRITELIEQWTVKNSFDLAEAVDAAIAEATENFNREADPDSPVSPTPTNLTDPEDTI